MILRPAAVVLTLSISSPAWAADTRSSESGRPRGVSPEFAKFFKPSASSTFTCISNPSISIPFSQVNDDYCDCPDGSDEPGTSACSYLSNLSPPQPRPGSNSMTPPNETLALPGFYCKNKGHVPAYIPFESVNDGICDYQKCCDGSDEYARVGGVKCEDRCGQIGKEYRKHEEARQKSMNKAIKKKNELKFEAERIKKEVETKVVDLDIRIKALEIKVQEAEQNFKETEQREKLRAVKSDAAGKGKGKLGVLLTLTKERISELRNTVAKTRKQRDDMFDRVTELEKLLSDLKEQHNPNFNDAGVKTAVQGWEDYAARDTDDGWTEAEDRDVEAIMREDGAESGVNWSEFESSDSEEAVSDAAAIYSLTSYLPPSLQTWIDGFFGSFRQILVENGILPSVEKATNVDDSPAVRSARKARDDAQKDLSNAQNDAKREREELEKEHGPDDIFRALKNQCVNKESGEYVYSHCFMQKTTQKPKKGGGETNMGNFAGFEIEFVDDDLPGDGKGLGRGDRVVMKYENGQHCWSGPNRSTRVVLACSEYDEIWKVSESEKCVYRMEVGTPAVCGWMNTAANDDKSEDHKPKDEL